LLIKHINKYIHKLQQIKGVANQNNPGIDIELEEGPYRATNIIDKYKHLLSQLGSDVAYLDDGWDCYDLLSGGDTGEYTPFGTKVWQAYQDYVQTGKPVVADTWENILRRMILQKIKELEVLNQDNPGIDVDL
jgi:hypothetical protein